MIYTDKKTGYEIEVFTTKEQSKKETRENRKNFTGIEVVTNRGTWLAEIGCWFDDKGSLIDYDGVPCLPMECIRALRKAGWSVPRDYEMDAQ
jgi:hypothetical protein